MKPQYTTVFVIREVSTGKLIKFGSKSGWASAATAKLAFANHMIDPFFAPRVAAFDQQDYYVLEEIK